MQKDIWHYPRTKLAEQVIYMFEIGLSSALTFYAPWRMGKTEFLRKDIQPIAEEKGFLTFYFSFLDVKKNPQEEFSWALANFAEKSGLKSKSIQFLKKYILKQVQLVQRLPLGPKYGKVLMTLVK